MPSEAHYLLASNASTGNVIIGLCNTTARRDTERHMMCVNSGDPEQDLIKAAV